MNKFKPVYSSLAASIFGATLLFIPSARADAADEIRIRRKMDGIMLESIEYRQANIVDVINELSDLAREYDENESNPRKKGINFVLDLGSKQADGTEDDPWAIGSGGGTFADIPAITIKARHVSLKTALDMIMEMTGLEYHVDGNLVKISRKNASSPEGTGAEHPLLSAESIQVVTSFDVKKVRNPDSWRWFYYVPGTAKLKEQRVETTKLGFKGAPKGTHAVLLFDCASKTVYWKWITAPASKLFASEDAVNLANICFGPDPLVENVWCRLNPDWDHRWKISSRLLTEEIYGGNVFRIEKAMEWIEQNWMDAKSPEFEKLCRTFDSQTNQLNRIVRRKDELQIDLAAVENELAALRTSTGNEYAKDRKKARLQDERASIRGKLRRLDAEFENLMDEAKKTAGKLDKVAADYKRAQEKAPLEKEVRSMSFTVSVVKKEETSR